MWCMFEDGITFIGMSYFIMALGLIMVCVFMVILNISLIINSSTEWCNAMWCMFKPLNIFPIDYIDKVQMRHEKEDKALLKKLWRN